MDRVDQLTALLERAAQLDGDRMAELLQLADILFVEQSVEHSRDWPDSSSADREP